MIIYVVLKVFLQFLLPTSDTQNPHSRFWSGKGYTAERAFEPVILPEAEMILEGSKYGVIVVYWDSYDEFTENGVDIADTLLDKSNSVVSVLRGGL